MKTEKFDYNDALRQLETFAGQLERNEVPVDEMIERSARAEKLLKQCEDQIRKTQQKMKTLFEET